MIEDLIKLKKQVDTMIETYKDLHPDENYFLGRGPWDSEKIQKETALKRIREGYYEDTFRKEQGKKIAEPSQGQVERCVLDDT